MTRTGVQLQSKEVFSPPIPGLRISLVVLLSLFLFNYRTVFLQREVKPSAAPAQPAEHRANAQPRQQLEENWTSEEQ